MAELRLFVLEGWFAVSGFTGLECVTAWRFRKLDWESEHKPQHHTSFTNMHSKRGLRLIQSLEI